MRYFIIRFKMFRMLSALDYLFTLNEGFLSGELIEPFISSEKQRYILYRLRDAECVNLKIYDKEIKAITRGTRTTLYLLERTEIWANRFFSFVSGALATLLADWLIRHMT